MSTTGSTELGARDAARSGTPAQDTALDRRYRALAEHVANKPGGHLAWSSCSAGSRSPSCPGR